MARQRRRKTRTPARMPRLLPLVIVAACAALAVRLGTIGEQVHTLAQGAVSVSEARAEEAPARDALPVTTAAGSAGTESDPEPAPHDKPGDASDYVAEAKTSADAAGQTADNGPAAPDELSRAEIQVLQQLAERRDKLVERERALADRSVLLEAAETRIDEKVARLKDLRATLEGLIKEYEDQEDAKIRSLVKIYETMKPRDAARIFEELEMDTLLMVADRMKDRRLAAVMAELDPGKAKEVTVELARLRQLPKDIVTSEAAAE